MTYFTTAVYVQLLGFAIQCSLTHSVSLIICFSPFIHTFAPCFFQILNYSRHPCIWLMVPVGRPIEDFHLLGIEHAWHTIKTAQPDLVKPFLKSVSLLFTQFIGCYSIPEKRWNQDQLLFRDIVYICRADRIAGGIKNQLSSSIRM